MNIIDNLNWRYATKKFNPEKRVSEDDLNTLKEAVRLSVSAYGLQLYKVLVITNREIRERLKSASWNQSQITDSSHLFVFCNYTENLEDRIDEYIMLTSETRKIELSEISGYGDFMKGSLAKKQPEELQTWLQKQPYLAVSNLLLACAELKIDACPMEGFEPEKYNDILGLNDVGLNACVITTVGYRDSSDTMQNLPKVRKHSSALFETIE